MAYRLMSGITDYNFKKSGILTIDITQKPSVSVVSSWSLMNGK